MYEVSIFVLGMLAAAICMEGNDNIHIILGVVFFIIVCMLGTAGHKQRMIDNKQSKENAKNIFKKKVMKLFDKYQEQLDWIDNK